MSSLRTSAITPASIGVVVTLTQLGYAVGLLFIVPLGGLIERRGLILGQMVLSAAALVALAWHLRALAAHECTAPHHGIAAAVRAAAVPVFS